MTNNPTDDSRPWSVFLIFLRLGLTSFGGPIAHLGYFRAEFVTRRRWLSERSYADLVALCQFLPGPASSQVGIAVGLSRAGYSGALAAWAGFTLPSAIALILFALGISSYGDYVSQGALHGLKVVAVAVVAQAVWGMARNLCTDGLRVTIMAIATCVVLLVPSAWGQVGVIAIAGIAGRLLFKPAKVVEHDPLPITVSHRAGVLWLSLFFVLLIGLPVLAELMPSQTMAMVIPSIVSDHWCSAVVTLCCHYCKPKWCPPAGSTMNPFSRGTGQLKRCPALCSRSPRFLVPR